MQRKAACTRTSTETDIAIQLNLDGQGVFEGNTGIGFLDHMLTLWAKHGHFDLECNCKGDLEVDCHHTVEDIGICLGQAIAKAAGDRAGIVRYGTAFVPMDETLAQVTLDFSGRPYLVFEADLTPMDVGGLHTQMVEEFFRAVTVHAGLTLHIRQLSGRNAHHIIEAFFKAFARALDEALVWDSRVQGVPSSKGILD